jgi:mannose-6-phosphate isomerase
MAALLPSAGTIDLKHDFWLCIAGAAGTRNSHIRAQNEVGLMVIEHARAHALPKPWGVLDLSPWSDARHDGGAIGEIRYERPAETDADSSSLLLKLLFTNQPLSIQVHPDDAFAHEMRLPRGKTEAWYVLGAASGAKVALGLNHRLTPQQLREAADDGSISDLVRWQTVVRDDIVVVPAGTIHAIGAGLVIAEIQQRSDATFRLFDYGRRRELHIEQAIAVADAGPFDLRVLPNQITDSRTLLVSNPHFVFERLDLAANSAWCLEAERETWLLVVRGGARVGSFDIAAGGAVFAQSDNADIHVGAAGVVGLVAYTGASPLPHLLEPLGQPSSADAGRRQEVQVPVSLTRAKAAPAGVRLETTK